ncbi:MAG: DNA repair protein RecO [Acidimicrobiales bacterium]|jgi:DNA repair protein RecO (recombination protein O)
MATYRDEGVVLRTIKLGEADRIVTFATPEHGKVRAVAKGIRKPRSRLAGRLEPLTHVNMMCWRGRDLDVVNQVEAIQHFKAIREDLDRVPIALTMLEVVDHVALERQAMAELFRMLVGALQTLEERPSPALLGAFLWKLLSLEGVGPSLDQCARCGAEVELVAFDAGEGGFLCRTCRRGQAVGPETVSLIRQVLNGGLRAALELAPGRATAESERLAMIATEYHLDRRVRSAHRGAEITTAGSRGERPDTSEPDVAHGGDDPPGAGEQATVPDEVRLEGTGLPPLAS